MSAIAHGAGAEHRPTPDSIGARYQRLAWFTLGTAFLVFVLLVALGLYAAIRYGEHAADTHPAEVQIEHGTKLEVQRAGQKAWTLASDKAMALYENDSVRTGQDTEALLTLFDGSTVQLYYSTTITLKVMRTSQFLNQFKTIEFVQAAGSIKAAAAAADTYAATKFHVFSDDGRILITLPASSVALITVGDSTGRNPNLRMTVATQVGEVTVHDNNQVVSIPIGRQRRVFAGDIIWEDEPAEADLIENGAFLLPTDPTASGPDLVPGWRLVQSKATLDAQQVQVAVVTDTLGGRTGPAVRFARAVPDTAALATVTLHQDRDLPINYYTTLKFQASVKVGDASAPIGNLYPLTLRVVYTDIEGNNHTWERDFYASEGKLPDFNPQAPTVALVPAIGADLPPAPLDGWDLMDPNVNPQAQPARVKAVEIVVSGVNFNVFVSNLKLTAR